jgi:predicted small secreted protein
MRTTITTAFVGLFILFSAASLVAGCNTTAGAGKDISATGRAITNEADENKTLKWTLSAGPLDPVV